MIADIKGKGEILFAGYVTMPYNLAVFCTDKTVAEVDTETIPIENRVFRGKPLKGVGEAQKIVAMKYRSDYDGGGIQIKF